MSYATRWSKSFRIPDKPKFRLLGSLSRYKRHQNDYRKLKRLPDHVLDDLGLNREEIEAAERASRFWL